MVNEKESHCLRLVVKSNRISVTIKTKQKTEEGHNMFAFFKGKILVFYKISETFQACLDNLYHDGTDFDSLNIYKVSSKVAKITKDIQLPENIPQFLNFLFFLFFENQKLLEKYANLRILRIYKLISLNRFQYDRLFVENDVFLYNDVEQRVERVLMKVTEGKPTF